MDVAAPPCPTSAEAERTDDGAGTEWTRTEAQRLCDRDAPMLAVPQSPSLFTPQTLFSSIHSSNPPPGPLALKLSAMDVTPAFRIAMLSIEIASLVLVLALMITTAVRKINRHPVINALLFAVVLHSTVYIWPGFFHAPLSRMLSSTSTPSAAASSSALAVFCATDALLVRYMEIVQAAFYVSFAVAIMDLARNATERDGLEERSRRPAQPLCRTGPTLILCAGPFVWALPVFFVPIPHFLNSSSTAPLAQYTMLYCVVPDHVLRLTSIVLLLVPLCLAVFLSLVAFYYITKFYSMHRHVLTSSLLDLALVVRFSCMVGIIIASTVLVILNVVFELSVPSVVKAGIIWESVASLLQFMIFAAQQDSLTTWWGWLTCACCWMHESDSATTLSSRHYRSQSGTTDAFLPSAPAHPAPVRPEYRGITLNLPGSRLSIPILGRNRTPTPTPTATLEEKPPAPPMPHELQTYAPPRNAHLAPSYSYTRRQRADADEIPPMPQLPAPPAPPSNASTSPTVSPRTSLATTARYSLVTTTRYSLAPPRTPRTPPGPASPLPQARLWMAQPPPVRSFAAGQR